uniref:Uncharacterized protein n=1 Tax=Neobodo designis TaxID=312471 RepID=A0A6U4RY04_NEODS|mmetsp:Transcript_29051/g.89900  ORF Transcript_29051/g.89900 Transcript_29051/m.89900 type:complete len:198 (+) Transcript_29051:65-658(+)
MDFSIPLGVPFMKVAAFAVVTALAAVTYMQCEKAYQSEESSVRSKLCIAEELESFHHDHWLHETTLLGAARLRRMLRIDPAFDVAMLAPAADVAAFARNLEAQCGFTLVAPETADDWTWELAAKGKVFKLSRFEKQGDRLIHREASRPNEVLDSAAVLPTTPCNVGRAQFQCPRDEHAFLTAVFGKQWRTAPLLSFL